MASQKDKLRKAATRLRSLKEVSRGNDDDRDDDHNDECRGSMRECVRARNSVMALVVRPSLVVRGVM